MDEVKLNIDEPGHGFFTIMDGAEKLSEMEVSISGNILTVHHTEVSPKAEGKGLAKMMFGEMVDYARKNELKVTALCPFAHAQFKRHSELYEDVWNKDQA